MNEARVPIPAALHRGGETGTGPHPETRAGEAGAAGEDGLTAFAFSGPVLDRLLPFHLVVAPDGRIRHAGPTLRRIVLADAGVDPCEAGLFDLFSVRRPRGAAALADLLGAEGGRLRLALRGRHADLSLKGQAVPLGAEGAALVDLSFGISIIEAVKRFGLRAGDFSATDLTVEMLYLSEAKTAALDEARRLNDRLHGAKRAAEQQALTDTLTGVWNRRALDLRLSRLIDGGGPFAVMHLDLDFFKRINDEHGHAAGDAVLQVVARRLDGCLRPCDTVARMGGDEFILLIDGIEDRDRLAAIAERLIGTLHAPVPFDGLALDVSASIGIAATGTGRSAPRTADQLLRRSDEALYAAKRAGRGRYGLGPPEVPAIGRSAPDGDAGGVPPAGTGGV